MRECKVKHSESKEAWNIISTIPGDKYKIARVPYVTHRGMSEEYNHNQKNEAYKDAVLMSKAGEMLTIIHIMLGVLCGYKDSGLGIHSGNDAINKAEKLINELKTL